MLITFIQHTCNVLLPQLLNGSSPQKATLVDQYSVSLQCKICATSVTLTRKSRVTFVTTLTMSNTFVVPQRYTNCRNQDIVCNV